MSLRLRAVVFDFDGTVLDTESACYASWSEMYARLGCRLEPELWANVVGSPPGLFDPWRHLEEQLGRALDRDALEAERRAREAELIARQPLRPGVVELLRAAKEAGLGVGLATSSRLEWVERHLAPHGLRDEFEAVATADDVERLKPDPALYTLAIHRLGVRAEEAIAIEDSPTGALGAVRAGLACVVVPNELTEDYDFSMAHAQWPTLAGRSVADLERVWSAVRLGSGCRG